MRRGDVVRLVRRWDENGSYQLVKGTSFCISVPVPVLIPSLLAAHLIENALIRVPIEEVTRGTKAGNKHIEKEYHSVSTTLANLRSTVRPFPASSSAHCLISIATQDSAHR